MSHLNDETLARLVDEPPTELEAAHLHACDDCRAELDGLRAQTRALAALPGLEPPATAWPALERRLRQEGLLRAGARGAGVWLRRAAVIVVMLGAGAGGAALQSRLDARGRAAATDAASASPAATDGRTRFAASGREDRPRSAEEALRRLRAAEDAYVAALSDYNDLAPAEPSGDLSARLAALEGIALTTGAALNQAPADPVINGYHLTALAQREATLRRIAATRSEPWF